MRRAFLVTALVLVAAACGDSADRTTTLPPATTTTVAPTATVSPTTTAPPPTTTTTTLPPATTTAPPTTTTVPPTTTTAASTTPVLSGDGLGVAAFGEDAETALAALTQALGTPTLDEGWQNALDAVCRGTQVRFPQWGAMFVILTDAGTDYAAEGTPHLAFWAAFDTTAPATPSGYVPGVTTYQTLLDDYGPLDPTFEDLFDLWLVDIDTGAEAGIQFEIEDPERPDLAIVGMSAGARDICGE